VRLLIFIALFVPASALAGGFAISEMGSRYAGRANAAVAVDDSPASIFYNPANLTSLPGLHIEAGISLIFPSFEYQSNGEGAEAVKSEASMVTPPAFSASYTLTGLPAIDTLSFGLGFYVPYGSTFGWPEDWVGNQALQEISMAGYEISPVVAIRPHPMIAIGGGLRVIPMTIAMKRAVGFGSLTDGNVDLAGSGVAIGGSDGLTFWPIEELALSLAWRSPATLNAEGESNFTFPAPFDTLAHDRILEGTLPLPQVFRAGAALDVIPNRLNVSLDFEYQIWSPYEELAITFIHFIDPATGEITGDPADQRVEEVLADAKDSENSLVFHLGAEWWVLDDLAVRAGYVYDQKTIPERNVGPAPPDTNRHVISVGASYMLGSFGIHAHFADVIFVERETLANDLRGTWSGGFPGGTTAFLVSLGVSAALFTPDAALTEKAPLADDPWKPEEEKPAAAEVMPAEVIEVPMLNVPADAAEPATIVPADKAAAPATEEKE